MSRAPTRCYGLNRRAAVALSLAGVWIAARPEAALACAACYGQSDSPLAAGMNWGIFSLLGCIVLVLGGVAGFFVFLVRRAERMPLPGEQQDLV